MRIKAACNGEFFEESLGPVQQRTLSNHFYCNSPGASDDVNFSAS